MTSHPIPEENFDLYALGVLEGEEKRELEEHVAACATCGREMEEARSRIAMLALAVPAEAPSPRVKTELMQKITGAPREYRAEPLNQSAKPARAKAGFSWSPAWALAAMVFAVATFLLWMGNRRSMEEIGRLRGQLTEAQARQAAQQSQNASLLNLITAGDTATVAMTESPSAAQARGRVFYNSRMGLLLYSGVLPAAPADKTYQLWLVPASGNPISAGTFNAGNAGASFMTASMPAGMQAKAFAVTIEPAGGMPQPTGPKVLIGPVS